MITHFAKLQLNTTSIQGVKQFYYDLLSFPVVYESDDKIQFQPTANLILSFIEIYEPICPAHIAFEVPYSTFDSSVAFIKSLDIQLLKWPNGRQIDEFGSGRNVYFKDGDGNLLEIISHSYINDGLLLPMGELKILYLREIGFPVDDVVGFREWLKSTLQLKTPNESDTFNFVIGGTAHAIVTSKQRKWIPISMLALPPRMKVSFGTADPEFIHQVRSTLKDHEFIQESSGELHFVKYGYRLSLLLEAIKND